jgi:asparagine synthetase B (glutamine-hydrolysing)
MKWTFERVFYGSRKGLNVRQVRDYLARGYCFVPYTLFDGYYKAITRVGDHDSLYARIEKPFPDVLLAHKPDCKFALHLSGGYDSSILAKLYDREDADYIHFTGPESVKARALAATLKGRLHEIQLTPELFITTAEEIIPCLDEPYAFEDVVYAYLASRKAKELGHTLVISGDGGGGVWGGVSFTPGPYSRKLLIAWKTIGPNTLLGLETLQPYMHTALYAWSKTTERPREPGVDKPFARDFCRQLGMPEVVAVQKKSPWAGSLGERTDEKIIAHMAAVVNGSDYNWIKKFEFQTKVQDGLLFRQYSLVRWLQANYKQRLEPREIWDVLERVRDLNAVEEKVASILRRRENIKQFLPPIAIRATRAAVRRLTSRPIRRPPETVTPL